MFDWVKSVIRLFKAYGIKGVMSAVNQAGGSNDVLETYGWITDKTVIPLDESQKNAPRDKIVINWVIPDVSPGAGGHTTIFRFIGHLERMGLHNRIYIYNSTRFTSDEDFRSFLKQYFSHVLTEDSIEAFYSVDSMSYADVTIATGWQTAYFVRRFNNTSEKFYFVQDFEPAFYPLGSEYLFAENTYKFGFKAITAGEWLKNKMNNDYGMEAESFSFSCDKEVYKIRERKREGEKLFFYARPVTSRRAFEMGLLALNEICKRRPDVEVIFAGWDISKYNIPFRHKSFGTVKPEDLAKSFSECDICLVMSVSNLSLMPLEIMSSGSVCATSYGDNNEWLLSNENTILFKNDPADIADKICYYLEHRDELEMIRKNGMELAASTDWEKEARKVYNFILEVLEQDR